MSAAIVFDTPITIEYFRLCTLKHGLRLQSHGIKMSSRMQQATTIARERYGLKGNLESLTQQVDELIAKQLILSRSDRQTTT